MIAQAAAPRLFRTDWLPALVGKIFAQRPNETPDQWADQDNVFLDATMAAEPGYYRSEKTPYTRRIQRLGKLPFHNGRRIRKIAVKKSSQSGFTEAVLNIIRWLAKFAPRNVIYAINSKEEVTNIRNRLMKTISDFDGVFTGDPDDIGKFKLTLRYMLVWFLGSYSSGSYANKQAPFCVTDEAEEHAKIKGDTTTVDNLDSRLKDAEEGLHIVLSKPKLAVGIIAREHARGNQEIYLVPCPFCGTLQQITHEKLKFSHCKNMLGEWDKERVLSETFFECEATYCGKLIPERYKREMIREAPCRFNDERKTWEYYGTGAVWFATHGGDPEADPEVVSQHISDLYSLSSSVSWGRIALNIIETKHDRVRRQGVWNHNLGLEWRETVTKPQDIDILKCRFAYKRGEIPWPPARLLLGADVGKNYARWVVVAFSAKSESADAAIVDWGSEIHPDAIAEIVNSSEYRCRSDGELYKISNGALDAKHRVEDSYGACMKAPMRLWPVMGGGGRSYRKSFGLSELPTYPPWLKLISFNDRDFKTELYVVRIKREVPPDTAKEKIEETRAKLPKLLVPENVTNDLIKELTAEHLEEEVDEETGELTGQMAWKRKGPNHYGDCVKEACVLQRWLNRNRTPALPKVAASIDYDKEIAAVEAELKRLRKRNSPPSLEKTNEELLARLKELRAAKEKSEEDKKEKKE